MDLNWWQTIIIAIVEGLTEFLPISSTGHMIITQHILGIPSTEFVKAFTVIIQFGAILSVIVLYWKRFFRFNACKIFESKGIEDKSLKNRLLTYLKRFLYKYDFYWKLFIAFIPAAVFGFLFSDKIDELLENVTVIAIMLIVGGVLMLFIDNIFNKPAQNQQVNVRKAWVIGFCQCTAMIPGVSRSMATIVGGLSQKLNRKNAAEFSFFLAVPTMFAASAYKIYELITNTEYEGSFGNTVDLVYLISGSIVAFIVAIAAIKFFIGFVTKYGFKVFGYYRIILGGLLLALILADIPLNIM